MTTIERQLTALALTGLLAGPANTDDLSQSDALGNAWGIQQPEGIVVTSPSRNPETCAV